VTGGGVVDASGIVASILASYRNVGVEYQRRVTGDPGALTAAAQRRGGQASTVSGKSREVVDAATGLHAAWEGAAYDAYAAASGKIGTELGAVGVKLDAQAMALTGAATALRTARASVDSALAQFDQYARQLTNLARTASASAVNDFVTAARQLGESLVAAAKAAADQLGVTLAQLFSPESTVEIGRVEHEFGKYGTGALRWVNGEPLDGRSRPRSSPSWFGNSGWKKLTWDGLQGTRAPRAGDTPFGRPEPTTLGGKAWQNTEITYAKWQGEQNGITPGWDFKVASQGWDAKAAGHVELAALHESVDGKLEYGVAEASGKASVFVGAEGNLAVQAGAHGVGAHLNGFVGGKVEGEVAADVAGVGVGASGTLQYGLGAQLDAQAVYDAGHVKVDFKAGAALGLGFGVGAKIDIDLPKMYETAEEYGGVVVDGVSGAANDAATAIGSMWDGAASFVETAYAESW
jgi:uncharacterized protein YukE